jgi:hypothetical protein
MERQSHNNPWADKLQEVSIPEAGEAWQAMETLLNKELPGSTRTNWGHWGRWLGFSFSVVLLTVFVYYTWFGRRSPGSPGSPVNSGPAVAVNSTTVAGRSAVPTTTPAAAPTTPATAPATTAAAPATPATTPATSATAPATAVAPAPTAIPAGTAPTTASVVSPSVGAAPIPAGKASSSASPSSANTANLSANPRSSSLNPESTKPAGRASSASPSPAKSGHPPADAFSGSAHSGSALLLRPTRHPSSHRTTHGFAATHYRNTATPLPQGTANTLHQNIAATSHRSTATTLHQRNAHTRRKDAHIIPATTPAATVAGETPGTTPGAPSRATGSTIPQQHGLYHSDPVKIRSLGILPPRTIGGRMALPNWATDWALSKTKTASRSRSNSPLSVSRTGWKLGIGFNQPVVVGGQGAWNRRAGGVNPALLDYIPVPSISYYFQPKLYIQAEVRFHAPQYTQRNLAFEYTNFDTTAQALPTGNVYIEKLFYFQLPVSVHYSPFPNWSVGVGLEYSRFSKGIAYNPSFPGTKPTYLSKYPTLRIEPSELRGLVSLNYTFRNWVVGISYDAAFTRFMNTQRAVPTIFDSETLTRNKAFQLTLRYTLWDGRKRRSPAK